MRKQKHMCPFCGLWFKATAITRKVSDVATIAIEKSLSIARAKITPCIPWIK